MQEMYGIEPVEIDGEIVLKLNKDGSELKPYLEYWYHAFKSFTEERISEQDYNDWMDAFPTFAGMDETGLPIWGKDVIKPKKLTPEEELEKEYEIYIAANTWAGKKELMNFEEYKEFRHKEDNK